MKWRRPNRGAEELPVLATATLDPRFLKDREEGWSFSQALARWKSCQRAARFGAALQIAGPLVRKDRALKLFQFDEGRRGVKTCGGVDSDIEEDVQNDFQDEVKRTCTQQAVDEDVRCPWVLGAGPVLRREDVDCESVEGLRGALA